MKAIFNHLTLLVARLDKDGEIGVCRFEVLKKQKRVHVSRQECWEDVGSIKIGQIKNPVLLVITGYGIIRRVFTQDDGKEVERIIGNTDFIWEQVITPTGESVLSFTRKDRVAVLLERLEQSNVPVIETHIGYIAIEGNFLADDKMDQERVVSLFAGQWYERGLKWKELTDPGVCGNRLAELVLHRMKLPLLLGLLGLLLINYLWNDAIRKQYVCLQEELALVEKKKTCQEKLSREMQQVVSDFKGNEKMVWVSVLDKIAALIPEEIVLETWAMNPLLKSIEEKKSLVIRDGYIEMTGFTSIPEKVTLFTGKVGELDFIREVKLNSLSRNREKGLFYFKIWIRL